MDSLSRRPQTSIRRVADRLCQRSWFAALSIVVGAVVCGKARERDNSAAGNVARANVNIYAHTRAEDLSPTASAAKPLVYVPNSLSASVSIIDPTTYQVIRTISTGAVPQHVVPSFDMRRLWVLNNKAGTVTPIDPFSGNEGQQIAVTDPYNMYYSPDGSLAIVIAEAERRLDFRDPETMSLVRSLRAEHCKGIDHMEFTVDGRYGIATCEFSGQVVKVDLAENRVIGYLDLDPARPAKESMPQDIRSSADGNSFYVADMMAGGVWIVDPYAFRVTGFIKTGVGTHGIYPSRDGRLLYVTNRGWSTIRGGLRGPGSISVIDPATNKVTATWPIPGGGSPDMGNVTADGRELWVSGRYDSEVYVIDTRTGQLTHRIPVGREPHGLCVWPQPGRYSLGHTGNMR
jgi:YVTN family beta-propeller protein